MHYQDNRVSLCVIPNNPALFILKHYHDSPRIRSCIITPIQASVCNITTIQVSLCIITTIQVICALSQQSRYALSRQSRYLYALSLQSRYPFMRYHDNPGLRLCIITTIQVSLCIITQEETELRSRRSWISEIRAGKKGPGCQSRKQLHLFWTPRLIFCAKSPKNGRHVWSTSYCHSNRA